MSFRCAFVVGRRVPSFTMCHHGAIQTTQLFRQVRSQRLLSSVACPLQRFISPAFGLARVRGLTSDAKQVPAPTSGASASGDEAKAGDRAANMPVDQAAFAQASVHGMKHDAAGTGEVKSAGAGMPGAAPKKESKFRKMFTQYGIPFFVWWTFTWAAGLGLTYLAVSTDVVPWTTVVEKLEYVGAGNIVNLQDIDPAVGHFGMAVLINECWEPIRFPLTVASLLPVLRLLRLRT